MDLRHLLAAAAAVIGPAHLAARPVDLDRLAAGVDAHLAEARAPDAMGTGSALFDGEWWLATRAFAALGHLQLADAHPGHARRHVEAAERALRPLRDCAAWAFDTARWGGRWPRCWIARCAGSCTSRVPLRWPRPSTPRSSRRSRFADRRRGRSLGRR